MNLTEIFANASIIAKMCLLVPVATLGMSVAYAIRPDERRLALLRPLSLATIFAALSGFTLGMTSVLRGIAMSTPMTPESWRLVALGSSEACVPLFVAFGCLTVAWLVVALGMRRTTA